MSDYLSAQVVSVAREVSAALEKIRRYEELTSPLKGAPRTLENIRRMGLNDILKGFNAYATALLEIPVTGGEAKALAPIFDQLAAEALRCRRGAADRAAAVTAYERETYRDVSSFLPRPFSNCVQCGRPLYEDQAPVDKTGTLCDSDYHELLLRIERAPLITNAILAAQRLRGEVPSP
jgi:hypothetical protein